ncbi:hypothetical protein JK358_29520 [Nocardia sp. 2]|uniref:Bacterial Ig domain-containing protein n=1 Tax=Nocardia acididurans TaxID=2802282 RepID=A0ABS1MD19_9NOCA|nr:hypothetical protein [Nocardia acididurans]MBL1078553.1 hypothetical protein [Nocardia acididurans]
MPDTPRPNVTTPQPNTGGTPVSGAGLQLDPVATAPGGAVTASGTGCDPHAAVQISIGGTTVGNTTARADGGFDARLATGDTAIGHHQVTAACGRTLAAPLDIVLVSRVGGATTTATVLLFFLLIGGWFYGHRLVSHIPARRSR